MVVFWVAAAAMSVMALMFVVQPFLRAGKEQAGAVEQNTTDQGAIRQAQNVEVFRDRQRELEQDLVSGIVTQAEYDAAIAELELELLEDVEPEREGTDSANSGGEASISGSFFSASLILGVFVIGISISVYWLLGNYEPARQLQAMHFDDQELEQAKEAARQGDMSQLLDQLYAKLQAAPDNLEGWNLLARSAMRAQNYALAAEGFEQIIRILRSNETTGEAAGVAPFYGLLAQAHYFRSNGQVNAAVQNAMDQALALDENELNALGLMAIHAFDSQNYAEAARIWQKMLVVAPEHPSRASIEAGIVRAQQLGGESVTSAVDSTSNKEGLKAQAPLAGEDARISVRVELDESLRDSVNANETVFVIARSPSGPPMPLAVSRHRVADLPVEITLDDGMAMAPSARLSSVESVTVTARVSRSGQPLPQAGDLQGSIDNVSVDGGESLTIRIDTRL